LAAAAIPTAAAQPGRFKAVKGWKGTLTVELQSSDNANLNGIREQHSYNRGAKFDVLLDQWVPELNGWRGFAKGRGAVDDKTVTWVTDLRRHDSAGRRARPGDPSHWRPPYPQYGVRSERPLLFLAIVIHY
jgi:hypothetical protein